MDVLETNLEMRGFIDTSLANLPEPRSVEEVAAIALAVDREAERQYAALAGELRAFGATAVAALLEEIGGEHGARAGRLKANAATGERREIAPKELARFLPRALSENGAAACNLLGLTPYRVFAFAVELAQQSFKLYSYLAAAADNGVRDYAERLAGEELSRAARLRARRRQAFHTGGRQPGSEAYPAAGLVESRADLLAAAFAIEHRLAQRLAMAGEAQAGFLPACQATRQRAGELSDAAEQAGGPGGPMAEDLARFSHSAPTSAQADQNEEALTQYLLADCERAFTFYDAVAHAPASEAIMLQAQDLSQTAVERIRQVRASAGT